MVQFFEFIKDRSFMLKIKTVDVIITYCQVK